MASYVYNNDLVGKDKPWGHSDYLLYWQRSIYDRYNSMCRRCNDSNHPRYKDYGGSGIENHFVSLSQYYESLKKDSRWSDFKKHPELYEIDKDIKYGHGASYSPQTIMIVTCGENVNEMNARKDTSYMKSDKVRLQQARKVLGRSPWGSVFIYPSAVDAARILGSTKATISRACKDGHTCSRYNLKGWSFTYI